MGLSFRERIIVNGAVTTLLAAIEDPGVLAAILGPLAKVVAVGTVALEAGGYSEILTAAVVKAAAKLPAADPAGKK